MKTNDPELKGVTGVYGIFHRESGRVYVGSSVNIGKRIQGHVSAAGRGSPRRLHRAMRKHGLAEFEVKVLCRCSESELIERELFHLARLSENWSRCYNAPTLKSVFRPKPMKPEADRPREPISRKVRVIAWVKPEIQAALGDDPSAAITALVLASQTT